ncbi:hypothetical protein GEMRC1_007006 [Eukaryota sp. GEM-RC1]
MSYVPPHLRQRRQEELQTGRPSVTAPCHLGDDFPRSRIPRSASTSRFHESEKDIFGEIANTGINFDRYDDIPVEVSANPEAPPPVNLFSEITSLPPQLAWNIQRAGFVKPTPVQKYSIPVAMAKRDLMSCAQTGSGKTGAFLVPIIADMLMGPPIEHSIVIGSYRHVTAPSLLVLAPTRELAIQIHNECKKFTYKTGLNSVCLYGGAPMREQLMQLQRGCAIVVATPGRLKDVCERGRISLQQIQYLVLDEADRMLDMGFEPQIRELIEQYHMPQNSQGRLTLMFSATFPVAIQQLAQDFLHNYVFLAVGRVGSTTDNITQRIEYVPQQNKRDVLLNLLTTVEGRTLVFVNEKRSADSLEDYLYMNHHASTSIHGDRDQQQREAALHDFRSGHCRVLVATDVASRGLDIPNVSHVINYEFPRNIEDYVHRIGRTGRAGNVGVATSFLDDSDRPIFDKLKQLLVECNQDVPPWFTDMCRQHRSSGGGYRGGRGGGRYAAKDFRRSGGRGGGQQKSGGWSGSFADFLVFVFCLILLSVLKVTD